MSLQAEQGGLVFETSFSNGGLKAEQAAIIIETDPGTLLIQLVGGAYQDFLGSPLANGYLLMTINQPAPVYVSGHLIVEGSAINFRITLDANGNAVAGQRVFSTSTLTPTCQYLVQAFKSDGTTAGTPQIVSVPSSPLSYNIGNWIPTQPA